MALLAKDESLADIEITTIYTTSDGKKFDNEADALRHKAIEPVVSAYIEATGATGMVATRKANDIRAFLVWQSAQKVAA